MGRKCSTLAFRIILQSELAINAKSYYRRRGRRRRSLVIMKYKKSRG